MRKRVLLSWRVEAEEGAEQASGKHRGKQAKQSKQRGRATQPTHRDIDSDGETTIKKYVQVVAARIRWLNGLGREEVIFAAVWWWSGWRVGGLAAMKEEGGRDAMALLFGGCFYVLRSLAATGVRRPIENHGSEDVRSIDAIIRSDIVLPSSDLFEHEGSLCIYDDGPPFCAAIQNIIEMAWLAGQPDCRSVCRRELCACGMKSQVLKAGRVHPSLTSHPPIYPSLFKDDSSCFSPTGFVYRDNSGTESQLVTLTSFPSPSPPATTATRHHPAPTMNPSGPPNPPPGPKALPRYQWGKPVEEQIFWQKPEKVVSSSFDTSSV